MQINKNEIKKNLFTQKFQTFFIHLINIDTCGILLCMVNLCLTSKKCMSSLTCVLTVAFICYRRN